MKNNSPVRPKSLRSDFAIWKNSQRILTIGPASQDEPLLKSMADVATAFRLNTGHMNASELEKTLLRLDKLFEERGKVLPVILDLQGAKLRIGKFPRVTSLPEQVTLCLAEESSNPAVIPILHESVFRQTQSGDLLYLNDRKVIVRVMEKTSETSMKAERIQDGALSSGKGLNFPDRVFELARVTESDRQTISIGNRFPFVEYAVSFVDAGQEASLFRPLTGTQKLIAKIERQSALNHVREIDAQFDELWLCRGDLGAEADLRELGRLQREFAGQFPTLQKPKILAGEVLGSMIRSPFPSRSEIVHLSDALHAGFDGFVLSDETACGSYVPEVLRFLNDFFLHES